MNDMIDMIKFTTRAAIGDRKGVTAIEYALIAAVVAGGVIVAYRSMFSRLTTMVGGISFSSS